jgi:hypothetical protein
VLAHEGPGGLVEPGGREVAGTELARSGETTQHGEFLDEPTAGARQPVQGQGAVVRGAGGELTPEAEIHRPQVGEVPLEVRHGRAGGERLGEGGADAGLGGATLALDEVAGPGGIHWGPGGCRDRCPLEQGGERPEFRYRVAGLVGIERRKLGGQCRLDVPQQPHPGGIIPRTALPQRVGAVFEVL